MMASRLFNGCIVFYQHGPGPGIKINAISPGLSPFVTLKGQSIGRLIVQ